jgi:hypothetical protein
LTAVYNKLCVTACAHQHWHTPLAGQLKHACAGAGVPAGLLQTISETICFQAACQAHCQTFKDSAAASCKLVLTGVQACYAEWPKAPIRLPASE